VTTDQNAERLDWDTYIALGKVVSDMRDELLAEYEALAPNDYGRNGAVGPKSLVYGNSRPNA
jgi:hypothetical protein